MQNHDFSRNFDLANRVCVRGRLFSFFVSLDECIFLFRSMNVFFLFRSMNVFFIKKSTTKSKELNCIGAKSWFFQKFRPRKPCVRVGPAFFNFKLATSWACWPEPWFYLQTCLDPSRTRFYLHNVKILKIHPSIKRVKLHRCKIRIFPEISTSQTVCARAPGFFHFKLATSWACWPEPDFAYTMFLDPPELDFTYTNFFGPPWTRFYLHKLF